MSENIQILKDKGQSKFAVIDFDEYSYLKSLLSDPVKVQDNLYYFYIQNV